MIQIIDVPKGAFLDRAFLWASLFNVASFLVARQCPEAHFPLRVCVCEPVYMPASLPRVSRDTCKLSFTHVVETLLGYFGPDKQGELGMGVFSLEGRQAGSRDSRWSTQAASRTPGPLQSSG